MRKYFILILLFFSSFTHAGYILIDIPPNQTTSWMLITDGQGSMDSLFLDLLRVHGDSALSINSGWLRTLGVGDSSIVNVYKANVLEAATIDSGTIAFYALEFRFVGDSVFRKFENVTLETKLHQGTFLFYETPEPMTIILLGIGGILILRKRRNKPYKRIGY